MMNLAGGNFQKAGGGALAFGSVVLTLSNTSATVIPGGGPAQLTYIFNLDSLGNLPSGSIALENFSISPPGTFYNVNIFSGPGGSGFLVSTFTWIVGPSASYSGTLFPNVTVLPAISVAGVVSGAFEISGNSGPPAATSANLWQAGNFGSPVLGRIYVGDGSGWRLEFAKRLASVDTVLFKFTDGGVLDVATGITVGGSPISLSSLGFTTTGSGTVIALATSPALVTPSLGVATATSINKVAITAPATSATLTIANGKTLTVDKSLEFDGTDSTKMTFPGASDTVVTLGATQTLTAKSLTSPALTTPTIGGETISKAPRLCWTPCIPINPISAGTTSFGFAMVVEQAITITRMVIGNAAASAGCSTMQITVNDGSSDIVTTNMSNGSFQTDGGAISVNVAASKTLNIRTIATGCSTLPGGIGITVQYKMQ